MIYLKKLKIDWWAKKKKPLFPKSLFWLNIKLKYGATLIKKCKQFSYVFKMVYNYLTFYDIIPHYLHNM